MNSLPIHFGTDGWRAVIAEHFTFDAVRRIAQALSRYIYTQGSTDLGIAVSYDTRFLSQEFAQTLAQVVSANRIPVFLSDRMTPTPALSFAVKKRGLFGGVMITASHNPYFYNGVKFKDAAGGPAASEITRAIETEMDCESPRIDPKATNNYLQRVDILSDYFVQLDRLVDRETLCRYRGSVLYDPMNGAGIAVVGYLAALLAGRFAAIHTHPDPLFGGSAPEPIAANLEELAQRMQQSSIELALATDGDADRFAVLDKEGRFVQLHDLMPLLFEYLIASRGWSGGAVRTTSMHDTIDRIAAEYGRSVVEVPVGFKHVAEKMRSMEVVIAGEESGGFGYPNHMPERDGVLSSLLTIEMLASRKTDIRTLVQELRTRTGPFHYGRIDRHGILQQLRLNLETMQHYPPDTFAGLLVERVNVSDGVKLYFSDAWVLIRVSDTEPLFRVYCGAMNPQRVQKLLDAGEHYMSRH
ncbi:phosphoglucomutase/phosphomannomutase family protein [candidate division KSB1 bacterium]|nr:phosphoglucomutase/phosphomannomutase family protein [candidate division KSB1 bacterium]